MPWHCPKHGHRGWNKQGHWGPVDSIHGPSSSRTTSSQPAYRASFPTSAVANHVMEPHSEAGNQYMTRNSRGHDPLMSAAMTGVQRFYQLVRTMAQDHKR